MVYFVIVAAFGTNSGGCLNVVGLIGPSIASQNYSDYKYYLIAHFLGSVCGSYGWWTALKDRPNHIFGGEAPKTKED